MNEQDQIKAIAELDGLREEYIEGNGVDGVLWFNSKNISCNLPHYLTSRDAIVPVIEKWVKTKNSAVQNEIVNANCFICCLIPEITTNEHFEIVTQDCFNVLMKTPPQLAEALLRATGKWIE